MKNKKAISLLSAVATLALVITLGTSMVLAQETENLDPAGDPAALTVSETVVAESAIPSNEAICPVTGEVCTGEAQYANQNRSEQAGIPKGEGFGDQQRLQVKDGSCADDPDAAQARRDSQRTEEGKGRGAG